MKTKNVSSLLTVIGLLAAFSNPAKAEKRFPVLQPEGCATGKQIKFPEGANATFYMSENCSTAFILPSDLSPMRVSNLKFGSSVNEADCQRAENIDNQLVLIDQDIKMLNEVRVGLNKSLAQRIQEGKMEQLPELRESIAQVQKILDEAKKEKVTIQKRLPYANFNGISMNVGMTLDMTKEVNAYADLNKNSGIEFVPAGITGGIISFATPMDLPGVEFNPIIGAKIPGLNAESTNRFEFKSNVFSTGGLVALVVVNQPAACNLIKAVQPEGSSGFDKSLLKADDIGTAGFTANYTYDVPVSTNISFKMKGSVEGDELSAAFKASKKKDRYSMNDVSELFLEGTLSNNLQVEYGDGGLSPASRANYVNTDSTLKFNQGTIFNVLFAEGLDFFTDLALESLVSANLLDLSVVKELENPEATQETRYTPYQDCHWKTKWGGRPKRKCSTKQRAETHWIPGTAFASHSTTNARKVEMNMDVKVGETIVMMHTTGFEHKKGVK